MIEITKRGTHVMVLISHSTQSNDGHYYGQIKRIPTAKFHVYVFDIHTVHVTHVRHLYWSVLYLQYRRMYPLRSRCTGCSRLSIHTGCTDSYVAGT